MKIFILFALISVHEICHVFASDSDGEGLCEQCVSNNKAGICKRSCTPGTEHSDPSKCDCGFECCTPAMKRCFTKLGAGVLASEEACDDETAFFIIPNSSQWGDSVCCVPKLACSPTPDLVGACINYNACNTATSIVYNKHGYCKTLGHICCLKRPALNKKCFASEALGTCRTSGTCIKGTESAVSDKCAAGLDCCLPTGPGAPCNVTINAVGITLNGVCRNSCGIDAEFDTSNCKSGLKCCVKPRGPNMICANNAQRVGACASTCSGKIITCTPTESKICSKSVCCDRFGSAPVVCN